MRFYHAKYEQNLPSKYASQPIGKSASMSIHESQSLFLEKKLDVVMHL